MNSVLPGRTPDAPRYIAMPPSVPGEPPDHLPGPPHTPQPIQPDEPFPHTPEQDPPFSDPPGPINEPPRSPDEPGTNTPYFSGISPGTLLTKGVLRPDQRWHLGPGLIRH